MVNKIHTANKVSRRRLSTCYVDNMVEHLVTTKKISKAEARNFVLKVVKERVRTPKMDIVRTARPGELKTETVSFSKLIDWACKNVIAPSGSIYKPANETTSVVVDLILDGLANRDKKKKEKFKHLGKGEIELANKADSEQNTLKVKLNSLPGNLGSPYSLVYDKGGYNSITSTARMLISNSFTCCEQLLGGNLPLFSEEEAVNLCIISKRLGPSSSTVLQIMQKHGIQIVSKEEVLIFLTNQINLHQSGYKPSKLLINLIENLPEGTLQFVFYHSNLVHLIQRNDQVFRPMIENLFDYSDLKAAIDKTIDPQDWHKIDSDTKAVVTTVLANELGDTQPHDIPSLKPMVARLGVMFSRKFKAFHQKIEDLMELFVFHDVNFQSVLTRKAMQRRVVVVSDTDSVIFTAEPWCIWYTKESDKITHASYCMSALTTYWLTKANADTMAKFIIGVGAIGEAIPNIAMKNEFLYPSLMLFDIKKMYAGLIAVQEGVIMPQLKPDIKGGIIRGASASQQARDFNKELLVDKVLKPIAHGPLDVWSIVDPVIEFEDKIIASLKSGSLEYHPIASVDTKTSYKKPMSSAYAYVHAWNYIFGDRYGVIIPPDKLHLVKLVNKPTEMYWEWLKKESPEIYTKFKTYTEQYCTKHIPSAFFLSDDVTQIPKEIIPLIDVRSIVLNNLTPAYHILASLNVPVGYRKQIVLLRDIYGGPIDEV